MSEPESLLNKIKDLEITSRQLEPNSETRNHIFQLSSTFANNFINTLPERKTYIKADFPKLRSLEITGDGKPFEFLLDIVANEVNHAGINSGSGGHMGYIPGGGLWLSSIGDMLAAVTNKNSVFSFPVRVP